MFLLDKEGEKKVPKKGEQKGRKRELAGNGAKKKRRGGKINILKFNYEKIINVLNIMKK